MHKPWAIPKRSGHTSAIMCTTNLQTHSQPTLLDSRIQSTVWSEHSRVTLDYNSMWWLHLQWSLGVRTQPVRLQKKIAHKWRYLNESRIGVVEIVRNQYATTDPYFFFSRPSLRLSRTHIRSLIYNIAMTTTRYSRTRYVVDEMVNKCSRHLRSKLTSRLRVGVV